MLIKEIDLCKEKTLYFFKNVYEIKGFGANILVKEFAKEG